MKPERQFATAELMASMNNFTATYAKAILAATRQEDLARPERAKKVTDGTLFLTCWMTYAQIEKLRTEKVMFKDLQ